MEKLVIFFKLGELAGDGVGFGVGVVMIVKDIVKGLIVYLRQLAICEDFWK